MPGPMYGHPLHLPAQQAPADSRPAHGAGGQALAGGAAHHLPRGGADAWAKAGRAAALALSLMAALHGPIAEVLGDGDFGARITRAVRVRAGRNEIRIGGGLA